jgi:hypothetical protein
MALAGLSFIARAVLEFVTQDAGVGAWLTAIGGVCFLLGSVHNVLHGPDEFEPGRLARVAVGGALLSVAGLGLSVFG